MSIFSCLGGTRVLASATSSCLPATPNFLNPLCQSTPSSQLSPPPAFLPEGHGHPPQHTHIPPARKPPILPVDRGLLHNHNQHPKSIAEGGHRLPQLCPSPGRQLPLRRGPGAAENPGHFWEGPKFAWLHPSVLSFWAPLTQRSTVRRGPSGQGCVGASPRDAGKAAELLAFPTQ